MRLRHLAAAAVVVVAACHASPTEPNPPVATSSPPSDASLPERPAATALATPVPIRPRASGAGAVVVRLRDRTGAAWDTPTAVQLSAGEDVYEARTVASLMAEHGDVRFDSVPAGVRVHVAVSPTEPTPQRTPKGWTPEQFATVRRSLDGPAADGDVVNVDLVVGRPRPSVAGRLVDDDGRPVAGRCVDGVVFAQSGYLARQRPSQSAVTSADGRFALKFRDELPEDGVLLRLAERPQDRPGGRDVEIATVAWPAGAAPVLDVGDVRTRPTTVAVAGRFVAGDGAQVALDACTAGVARRFGDFWSCLNGFEGRASADGRFEIRGDVAFGAGLSLVGTAPDGFVVERAVPLDAPAQDHVLRVVRCASVTGSVVLPRGVEAWDCVVANVEGPGSETGSSNVFATANWAGATFTFPKLLPGRSRVAIRVRGEGAPIATAELDLAPGEAARPPALQSIDLGPRARARTIRVVDERGAPVANADVWTRAGEAEAPWTQCQWGRDGAVRRTFLSAAFDAVALAPGMQPAERRDATGDVELVLRPAVSSVVRVRLAPDVALPPPPLRLGVALAWHGTAERPVATVLEGRLDPRARAHITSKPFDASRTVTFEVEEPGRWAAELRVDRVAAGSGFGAPVMPCTTSEAIVTGSPLEFEIVVGADAAVCDALFRSMR